MISIIKWLLKFFSNPKEMKLDKADSSSKLNEARDRFKENKFDAAIKIVEPDLDAEDTELRYEAKQLAGLSYFQLKRYDESEKLFIDVCITHQEVNNFFNLAMSQTLGGKINEGKISIDRAIDLRKKMTTNDIISVPNIIYYYLQALTDVKEWERSFEQLEILKGIYITLHTTDTTFLTLRGIPFLEYTIGTSKSILENISKEKAQTFIRSFKKGIDKGGQNYVTDFEKTIIYRS